MSNPSSPLKPAPLSFGRSDSGRMSPFRRPESPLGRSPSTVRAATPQQGSPLKQSTGSTFGGAAAAATSPTKSFTPAADDRSWINSRAASQTPSIMMEPPESPTKSPRPLASSTSSLGAVASRFESPSVVASTGTTPSTRPSYARTNTASTVTARPQLARTPTTSDPLSAIPPQHLHTMRESFAVLDRSNTGSVTSSDLTHQLNELGLDSSSAALSQYFPPGAGSLNLAAYLNLLSADLARLTSSTELLDALATFDADDSGQIDAQELKEALVSTMPDEGRRLTEQEVDMVMDGFTGRRAFKRGAAANSGGLGAGERRPVFRYGEFVRGIWGAEGEKVEVA